MSTVAIGGRTGGGALVQLPPISNVFFRRQQWCMLDLEGMEKRNTRKSVVNYCWLLHKQQPELRINMLAFGVRVSSSG